MATGLVVAVHLSQVTVCCNSFHVHSFSSLLIRVSVCVGRVRLYMFVCGCVCVCVFVFILLGGLHACDLIDSFTMQAMKKH